MTVLEGIISPTKAAARLNVCKETAIRHARSGKLPGVLVDGRLMFRESDIERARLENCRPRTESEQLTKIVETLVADPEPAPIVQTVPPASPFDERGIETLGRLPKIRHQVFRMGPDGERVLVREKFSDPPPPEKPADKKEESEVQK
jgi:hypothetical protein